MLIAVLAWLDRRSLRAARSGLRASLLDGEFGGQPFEDEHREQLAGAEESTGTSRRDVLRWNHDAIKLELE